MLLRFDCGLQMPSSLWKMKTMKLTHTVFASQRKICYRYAVYGVIAVQN